MVNVCAETRWRKLVWFKLFDLGAALVTEMSIFQAIKKSFRITRSVISSFAMRAFLGVGPGCLLVAS